eukprot:Rmarinus@m.5115
MFLLRSVWQQEENDNGQENNTSGEHCNAPGDSWEDCSSHDVIRANAVLRNDPAEDAIKEALSAMREELEHVVDDEGFLTDQLICMFLRARDWDVARASAMLRSTVEWRAERKPAEIQCRWCIERPGYHTWRQVGFDRLGRPVVYSCFAQAATQSYTGEDSVTHLVYAIENAVKTMEPHVEAWVWVLDFTGFGLRACNPALARAANDVLAKHYPERLGLFLALNPPWMFGKLWSAISVILDPYTAQKVRFVGSDKIDEAFEELFDNEMSLWLREEMEENLSLPHNTSQVEFWKPSHAEAGHDPRGTQSYVAEYLDAHPHDTGHNPHPNIIEHLEVSSDVRSKGSN